MELKMRLNTLFVALAALVLTGCFSGSSSTPEDVTPSQSSTATESIFPHKSNWKDPAQHGIYVKNALKYDTSSCTTCHDEDGGANAAKGGAPGCRNCHSVFPHTDAGVTLETHGQYVMKNGKSACTSACHGVDLKGGLNEVPCTKCHTSYPHESGWSTPSVHGSAAKGNLKLQCALCHGSDYNGGTTNVSCVSCHKGNYPHPTGWSSPDQHGTFVLKNGTGKCATQCHGTQLDGGLSGVSCNTCHSVWPHPKTGWLSQHGETARTIGISGCTGCHTNDATGGSTGVSCTQCHAALPGHQDADWLNGGHGTLVMQQPASLTDSKGCPLCHGAKLEGGKTPSLLTLKAVKGCNSCHASYPSLHKPTDGAAAWNTYGGHAKWTMDQVDVSKGNVLGQINTLIADCKLCHGDDLKGGSTGKSCYSCHANFPHNMNTSNTPWLAQHGVTSNAETPKAASCATANCHGKELQGLPVGENDVNKKRVKGCADCHLKMPHSPQGQWDHGKSVLTTALPQTFDVVKCAPCHGDTWTGKGNAPSCYTAKCHSNYPAPHRLANGAIDWYWKWIAADNQPVPDHGIAVLSTAKGGSSKNIGALTCKTCHGQDLTGGASGKTCYKCHTSFPHAPAISVTTKIQGQGNPIVFTFTDAEWDGQKGFAHSHGQYLLARAGFFSESTRQLTKAECGTTCHGDTLSGGNGGKACTSCHTNYPHPANWVKSYDPADTKTPGGAHGLYVLKNGTAGCLTACHGSDGKGGNSSIACTTCHNYPHKTGWKDDHTTNPEYPPHAVSVINTNNTPANKNDDTFNATAFDDCAKCHGPALDYIRDETYPFKESDKTLVTIDTGITIKRCTACHIYPHIKGQTYDYKWSEWKKTHGAPLFYWTYAPGLVVPNDTCGSAEGKVGCHTTGPTITVPGKEVISTFDGCNLCHK